MILNEWLIIFTLFKVEKVIDANSSNICSSVLVSGDDEANRLTAEFLGKFDAVKGKYSAGRMVYHNEETGTESQMGLLGSRTLINFFTKNYRK